MDGSLCPGPQVFLTTVNSLSGDCARHFLLSFITLLFVMKHFGPLCLYFQPFALFFPPRRISLESIQNLCPRAISYTLNWGLWLSPGDSEQTANRASCNFPLYLWEQREAQDIRRCQVVYVWMRVGVPRDLKRDWPYIYSLEKLRKIGPAS